MLAGAFILSAVLAYTTPLTIAAGATAWVIIALVVHVAPGGRTISDRISIRRRFNRPVRDEAMVVDTNKHRAGMVIDDDKVSVFLELIGNPYELTRDVNSEKPSVPLEHVIGYLNSTSFPIHSVNVISYGRRVADGSAYANIYGRSIASGSLSQARTIIQITSSLTDSMHEVYRRAVAITPEITDKTTTIGVTRYMETVAGSIRNHLLTHGVLTAIMSGRDVARFHGSVLELVNHGIMREKWDHLPGSESSPATRVFSTKQPDVDMIDVGDHTAVLVSRTIAPRGNLFDVTTVVGVCEDDGQIPSSMPKMTVEKGRQGDLATRFLPLAKDPGMKFAPTVTMSGSDIVGKFPAVGMGVRVGVSAVRNDAGQLVPGDDDVYLSLAGTKNTLFYTDVPESVEMSLLKRLRASGSDAAMLVSDMADKEMTEMADIPSVTGLRKYPVIAVQASKETVKPSPLCTVIAFTDNIPVSSRTNLHIDPVTNMATIRAGGVPRKFFWTTDADERAFLAQSSTSRRR